MQVESLLEKKIPLISSSFTHTPKIAPIAVRRVPSRIKKTRETQQDIDIIRILHAALIEAELRLTEQFSGTGMASTVSSDEDDKLAKTIPSPYQGTNHNHNNNSTLLPNKNKKAFRSLHDNIEDDELNRKRTKFSTLVDPNSSEEDVDADVDDEDNNDNSDSENKNDNCDEQTDKIIADANDEANKAPAVAEGISESARESICGEARAGSEDKSRDNSHVGKDDRIDLYENNVYIAPEQALVTSVELVVPAPPQAVVEQGSVTGTRDVYGDIHGELQYDSAVLFNSSGSANSQNNKIDGCVRDTSASSSSNLNVRIPTNVTLATPGDIMLTDHRRATIWSPHNENKEGAPGGDMHLKTDSETLSASTESAVYPAVASYRTQQHQRQGELLLQIEKEATGAAGAGGYAQMLPLSVQQHHHHHESTPQQHYSHQQTQQSHHLDANNQLQNNVYVQNMYVQNMNPHQHQHQHPHQHQTHYANYGQNQQHYSHEQLFGLHHPEQQHQHHHQQQQQQQQHIPHHMELECHGHLQQRSSHSHSQQQQMQEAYHDLMMEDFHEDPSSAYKLTLSPANAKPENQDDGYETSAGDVLTPNSHSSSTHSVTPQHHMQHSVMGLMAQNTSQNPGKNDEQLHPSRNPGGNASNANPNSSQIQVNATPPPPHLGLPIDRLADTRNSASMAGVDHYSFMGEEIRMLSPASRHTHVEGATSTVSNYAPVPMSVPNDDTECHSDLYRTHQSHQHQQEPQHYDDSKEIEANNNGKSNDMDSQGIAAKPIPKRRGRKKKLIAGGEGMQISSAVPHQCDVTSDSTILAPTPEAIGSMGDTLATKPKERKKHDRFNGMSEAEVIKRTIPDHLCDNLDIVIVGINPGLFAAYKGHHYAGPGNHFWKCLYLAGLTQEQMSADEDHKLIKHGIGFTNMVARATKGSADLTRKEIKEGSRILLEKLQRYRPKVAVFNGKLIFEVFSGKKEFHFGRQPDRVEGTDTYIWVMPSSSARCAQLPRAADKVPFYAALKKFRDYLNGLIPHIDESECVFTEQRIRQCCEQQEPHPLNPQSLTGSDQHASLLYIDSTGSSGGGGGGGGGDGVGVGVVSGAGSGNSSQNVEKILPHLAANESATSTNIVGRGPFMPYGSANAEDVIRSDNYLSVFGQSQVQPQEKKKRGRPKKIKGQDLIDPSTGNKITIVGQKIPHNHDFNNILNLSMLTSGNAGGGETPKKKRGRPKKLKPSLDNMANPNPNSTANGNPNTNPTPKPQSTGNGNGNVPNMHTLTMEHIAGSPQNSSHQVPPSLYNTPPPSHMLYTSSASPMASPALNCTYSHSQMPSAAQGTTPIGEISSPKTQDHMLTQKQTQVQTVTGVGIGGIRDPPHPHLGETPPPNSPNMCSVVDFEPPDDHSDSQGRSGAQGQGLAQDQTLGVDKAQYASPAHETEANSNAHAQEHYQQWLPHPPPHPLAHPHLQQNQQSEQKSTQHPSLNYQHEQSQTQSQSQSQSQPEHWPRYEDHSHNSSPYMLSSPHHHVNLSPQLSSTQGHNLNQNTVQLGPAGQQMGSDVARKSLSGLENLVDQIPAMSEHEPNSISSATAAAAAAAVESRLLGLQQQQQQQQQKRCHPQDPPVVQSESLSSADNSNAHALTNNFSVSNLATSASSTTVDTDAAYNSSPNPNSTRSENQSRGGEYAIHSPTPSSPAGYPQHANHLISAAFAAASANNSQSGVINNPHQHHLAHPHPHPHPPQHPHAQMYMDHAHITSHMAHMAPVNPMNPMYGPSAAAYSSGPQHSSSGAGSADYYGVGVGVGVGVQGAVQGGPATLHVPSPNYPYAHPYGHTPPQANYPGYAHAHHHHHHSHHPGHPSHHLSVFERLKPSDISGYTGF